MWTPDDIVKATGGRLEAGPGKAVFDGISIDSRAAGPGDVYVALLGERRDGHEFVPELLPRGGLGFVIQRDHLSRLPLETFRSAGAACFVVEDTLAALQALAAFHRRRLGAAILGITGTCGKTTTKEMIAAVLETVFVTHKTRGNLNNHIGVPLTLLGLGPQHQWAVVEMGMNHPGEIRRLAEIAAPEVGMVTNVLPGHLEGVGSLDGVAAAKKELLDVMAGGTVILNADDPRVAAMAKGFGGRVVFFGTSPEAEVRFRLERQTDSCMDLILSTPAGETAARVAAHGTVMASNACAAFAAGYVAGIEPAKMAGGLGKWAPVQGRLQVTRLSQGTGLLDDTYNANPGSVAAAIRTLVSLKNNGQAFLVLGDMRELGARAAQEHRAIGGLAARVGVDRLLAYGEHAGDVAQGAVEAGMPQSRVTTGAKQVLAQTLARELAPKDWVLVKGSRLTGMEEVISLLKEIIDTKKSV